MKKVIILLVALVGMISAMAQWVPQNSGTSFNLNSVYFTDANTGYAAGDNGIDNGIILKTTDGGINWLTQMIGSFGSFNSVYFTDSETGYLVGQGLYDTAYILKTSNGGTTWSIVYYFRELNGSTLTSVYFPDENTGYAVGHSDFMTGGKTPIILKTTNSGVDWTVNNSVDGYTLNSIYFTSTDKGYAVGVGGLGSFWMILSTTNGGDTWSYTYSSLPWDFGDLNSVYFVNDDIGYAVGSTLLKTWDGGIVWTELNDTAGVSIFFTDVITGYVVSGSTILKTTDGGANWIVQNTGVSSNLQEVYFPVADTGYVVGKNGTILKTTNGGTTNFNEYDVLSLSLKIFPNPSNDKIAISSASITGNTQLSIFNVSGGRVIERQLTETETQIDISTLPWGVYFVRVQDEKGEQVAKFVKE